MTLIWTSKHRWILIGLVLLVFLGTAVHARLTRIQHVYLLSDRQEPQEEDTDFSPSASSQPETAEPDPVQIVVHIQGLVHRPGVYTMTEGSRLYELVELAGGLMPDADPMLNLSRKLQDEAFVYVSHKDDEPPTTHESVGSYPILHFHPAAPNSSIEQDGRVNLNTANSSQLETLPGIGPVLAGRIIEYRQENGSFQRIEDIKKVSGIGDTRYNDLKDHLTI